MGKIYLNDIGYGGMSGPASGDQVYIDQMLNQGTHIADIVVNDITTPLYAPPGAVNDVLTRASTSDAYVSVLDQNGDAKIDLSDLYDKQDKLYAGSNISISQNNVISATRTNVSVLPDYNTGISIGKITVDGIDNTFYVPRSALAGVSDVTTNGNSVVNQNTGIASINDFSGATTLANGSSGLVPGPLIADKDKYLKGDGTWDAINVGSAVTITPSYLTGTKIADYSIDGSSDSLYIPDEILFITGTTQAGSNYQRIDIDYSAADIINAYNDGKPIFLKAPVQEIEPQLFTLDSVYRVAYLGTQNYYYEIKFLKFAGSTSYLSLAIDVYTLRADDTPTALANAHTMSYSYIRGPLLPNATAADEGKTVQVDEYGIWQKADLIGLPTMTSSDEGKILIVDSTGGWTPDNIPSQLPSVTSSDQGKVLAVNSSGEWAAAASSGGASALNDLTDVTIATPSNGQVLKYNSTTQKWENGTGGSAVAALNDLTDVTISNPSNRQALIYNSTSQEWENGTISSGGGNVDDVYVNGTSVLDNNQIAQVTSYKEVTQAEYDLLPSSKLTDGVLYCIKDSSSSGGGSSWDYSLTETNTKQKWINGKDIYCIVFQLGSDLNISNSGWTATSIPINMVDTIIDATFFYDKPSANQSIQYNCMLNKNPQTNANYLTAQALRNTGAATVNTIIMWYTKPSS